MGIVICGDFAIVTLAMSYRRSELPTADYASFGPRSLAVLKRWLAYTVTILEATSPNIWHFVFQVVKWNSVSYSNEGENCEPSRGELLFCLQACEYR